MKVWKPDGLMMAEMIQTVATAAHAQTTHGRGLPMSRSRTVRRVISVMGATLPVELRLVMVPDSRSATGRSLRPGEVL